MTLKDGRARNRLRVSIGCRIRHFRCVLLSISEYRAVALVLALLLQAPAAAAAQPGAEPGSGPGGQAQLGSPTEGEVSEHAQVEGFRSARWGMTDAQVKEAIRKDFNIPPEKVGSEETLSEKTTVLSVNVPDLMAGAGIARVSYILGYATKKLIQVNIVWGTPVDPQVKQDRIVAAANQLRQLFLEAGYPPDKVTTNTRLPDGTILVFQGQDDQKHTTLLRLAQTPSTAKKEKAEKDDASIALSLSYMRDSRNPDIYRLKKGQF